MSNEESKKIREERLKLWTDKLNEKSPGALPQILISIDMSNNKFVLNTLEDNSDNQLKTILISVLKLF